MKKEVVLANGITQYRINKLETAVNDLDTKLDLIMTNHLPHIQEQIIASNTTIKLFTGINIAVAILGIVAAKILK